VASNLRSGNLSYLIQHTIQCINLTLAHQVNEEENLAPESKTTSASTTPPPPPPTTGSGGGGSDFFLLEALNGMKLTGVFVSEYRQWW